MTARPAAQVIAAAIAPFVGGYLTKPAFDEGVAAAAQAALAALVTAGWTLRPPCAECDARHPCRLTYAEDNPGECALAKTGSAHV